MQVDTIFAGWKCGFFCRNNKTKCTSSVTRARMFTAIAVQPCNRTGNVTPKQIVRLSNCRIKYWVCTGDKPCPRTECTPLAQNANATEIRTNFWLKLKCKKSNQKQKQNIFFFLQRPIQFQIHFQYQFIQQFRHMRIVEYVRFSLFSELFSSFFLFSLRLSTHSSDAFVHLHLPRRRRFYYSIHA